MEAVSLSLASSVLQINEGLVSAVTGPQNVTVENTAGFVRKTIMLQT